MEMTLTRAPSDGGATIGTLTVFDENDAPVFVCHTLEDQLRPGGDKVPGATAIPAGRYRVQLTHSPRFGCIMPLLEDVPGFAGVRIHTGNTAADTEGCILVGQTTGPAAVYRSRVAYETLLARLQYANMAGEQIWLAISDPLSA